MNIEIAQKLRPEVEWGPRLRNKCVGKCVGPSAPHIFLTLFAESWPPDPLRTHLLRNYRFVIVIRTAPGDGQLQA